MWQQIFEKYVTFLTETILKNAEHQQNSALSVHLAFGLLTITN
jgi:hypothetical protein